MIKPNKLPSPLEANHGHNTHPHSIAIQNPLRVCPLFLLHHCTAVTGNEDGWVCDFKQVPVKGTRNGAIHNITVMQFLIYCLPPLRVQWYISCPHSSTWFNSSYNYFGWVWPLLPFHSSFSSPSRWESRTWNRSECSTDSYVRRAPQVEW